MKLKIQKNKFKFIYLEITDKCNLKCPFCPSSKMNGSNYMDLLTIDKYLKEICNYTNTIYLHILGEPLLHPNFNDIISLCNKYNLKVRLTTNGTLLLKYDFSNFTINKINISLQSLIQFDEKTINNYFANLKKWIDTVKTKLENKELGIDFRIWNDKNNEVVTKFNNIIFKYLYEYININNIPNTRISDDSEFTWPDEEEVDNKTSMKCLGGKTQLGILVSGDVVLCCLDYNGKTKIGNLNCNSLEEILASDIYQNAMIKMQAGIAYFNLCQRCKYRNKFK